MLMSIELLLFRMCRIIRPSMYHRILRGHLVMLPFLKVSRAYWMLGFVV